MRSIPLITETSNQPQALASDFNKKSSEGSNLSIFRNFNIHKSNNLNILNNSSKYYKFDKCYQL